MTNSSIQQKYKQKKYLQQVKERYRPSFKELSKEWKAPKIRERKLLPDTNIFPDQWTYLVSNEKHPHTITPKQFRRKKIKDGDKIYFERNQIYNWVGYDPAANNVTFGSYGAGADPIFRGSTALTPWTAEAGGYYSAPLATAPLWITIDGECARQGESDWIPTTSAGTTSTFVAASATLQAFNAVQSLVGAKVRNKEFNFRLSYEHLITAYNGTTTLTIGAGGVTTGSAGLGFKLYGQKQFATLQNDWWWDDTNDKLWIKSTTSPTDVRVITENYAFKVDGRSNITIENIDFREYYETAIDAPDAPNIIVNNVDVEDNRTNAVMFYGNNTTFSLSNFNFERIGLNAVHVGAVGSGDITDGTITEVGMQDNYGWPIDTYWIKTGGCAIASFWDSGEVVTQPTNVDVTGVTMSNLAYMGTLVIGDNHNYLQCIASNFCRRWSDGGGFYTIHRNTLGTSTKNVTFTECVAFDGVGSMDGVTGASYSIPHAEGFYVDNGCELVTMDQVISYNNTDRGILVNWDTQRTTITNSTIYGNINSEIMYRQDTNVVNSPVFTHNDGNILTGNVIASAGLAYCVEVRSFNSDPNYNPFSDSGDSDNNTYVRPYGENMAASAATSSGALTVYALPAWRTKFSDDAASTQVFESTWIYKNPIVARGEDIKIAVNATGTPTTVNATGYKSITGVALGASEPVPAWGSLIYLINAQPAPDLLLDQFIAANGTAIAGRAPTVGPIPTIGGGTHTINTNEWVSNPNGAVYWNINASNVAFTIRSSMSNISDGLNTYFRRVNDNNRMVLAVTATTITLFEFNASASATNSWVANYFFAINTAYFISVIANGTNVKVYVNETLLLDITTSYTTAGQVGALGQTTRRTDYVLAETP